MKKTLYRIMIGVLALVIICLGTFYFLFRPTPNYQRNNKLDGVLMKVRVSEDDRKPIIRTFKKEDFDNMGDEDLDKVKDKISGKIEGDIPSISLNRDNKAYFTFEKDGEKVKVENPRIKISAHASSYKDPVGLREIEGDLEESKDETYAYSFKRYSTQYEKYFIEYLSIEVYYTIDGEDYVSLFATNQDNANDGTDFFENKDLDKPLEPGN